MSDNALHIAASIIKKWEGLRLKSYRCSAGVLTIGFGHTGPDVIEGMEIDLDEADAMLWSDMWEASDCIDTYVEVPISDQQKAALISFVFNLGCGNFRNSSMLRLLNSSQYEAAAQQFNRWTKAAGKELPGLVARRADERGLFEQHGLA
jgi:lysozyme